jgi:hypothetical protein
MITLSNYFVLNLSNPDHVIEYFTQFICAMVAIRKGVIFYLSLSFFNYAKHYYQVKHEILMDQTTFYAIDNNRIKQKM